MSFTSEFVIDEVKRLRGSKAAEERAWGDSFEFEERIAASRCRDYETLAETTGAATLTAVQGDWFTNRLKRPVAAPFLPGNDLAAFDPGDPPQRLVRIEDLSTWIDRMEDCTQAQFIELFPAETDFLARFFAEWNRNRDNRPSFAAFRDELRDEIKGDDWALAIRAALGLGDLSTRRRDGSRIRDPILVGRMEYTVQDVLDATPPAERPHAFAAPTVIDCGRGFSQYFFPSPGPARGGRVSWGRTVHLEGRGRKLVCEMLHRPFPYRPDHLKAVALIDPPSPLPIWTLRNAHLNLLHSQWPGYGAEMAADD